MEPTWRRVRLRRSRRVTPRHLSPLNPSTLCPRARAPRPAHVRVAAMASEAGGDDLYAVLGVGRDASEEDIRRAYRSLAQAVHPDKHAGAALREVANAHFSRLHAAYEVLRRVRVGRSQATRPLAQLPFPLRPNTRRV